MGIFLACFLRSLAAALEQWIRLTSELLSIRDAVLTVSPNKQYRGFRVPTLQYRIKMKARREPTKKIKIRRSLSRIESPANKFVHI